MSRLNEKTKTQYHSRSYHRYFEDWAENVTTDKGGAPVIERIYVGSYYSANLSKARRVLRKILYAALYLAAAALYGFTSTRNTDVNMMSYASAPIVLSFPVLLGLAISLYFNLAAPAEMIVRQYRDASITFSRVCLAAFVLLGLSSLTSLLYLTLTPDAPIRQTLLCGGGYLLSALAVFVIWRLEKALAYTILPPRAERPENSTILSYESKS
jgi:hypothetical protein